MGGIHASVRTTSDNNYIGMQNKLVLPSNATSISATGANIKPEFINGIYKGNYGLDIGVVYEDGAFKLFYWALAGTTQGSQASKDITIGASFGEHITLKTYLNGSKITCQAIRANGVTKSLDCPLSPSAQNAFANGVAFIREMVIAADDVSHDVNPVNVFFYNATFSEGFVTTTNNVRHKLNNNNSYFTNTYDDGNINQSILKCLDVAAGTDANEYAYETVSCDLNRK